MSGTTRLTAALATAVLLGSAPCLAQGYPASQRGAVQQTVAFTDISIEGGRPVARGRVLFGDSALVKYGKVWNPGADSATRISFNHDVQVEGRDVKAGEYTMWLIPRATGAWTFILNSRTHIFHLPYPGEGSEVLHVDVVPERGAHMETLAFYFPLVLKDEAVMRFHWGEMIVPLRIKAPYRPEV